MPKKIAICPGCHTKITVEGKPGEKVQVECPNCKKSGSIVFKSEFKAVSYTHLRAHET